MSVLSTIQVRKLLDDKELGVAPRPSMEKFAASIDLRLGRWFITMRDNRLPLLDVADGRARRLNADGAADETVEGFDKKEEFEARKHAKETFVPFGERYILHPGRFVLAATLEWVTLPKYLMGFVTGKSSWARRGLSVEGAPGVHPGFSGCLTLEVANHGVVPIELRSGMQICQLFFMKLLKDEVQPTHAGSDPRIEPTVHGMRRKPNILGMKVDEVVERLRSST